MANMRLALVAFLIVTAAAAENAEFDDDDDFASVQAEDDGQTVVNVETVKPTEENEVVYLTPDIPQAAFFAEHFDDVDLDKRWVRSQAKKDGTDAAIAKYDGQWDLEAAAKDALSGDAGLVLKSKAKHAAISAKLKKPFDFKAGRPFIVQYELNFQNGQDCGGGYIKLLSHEKNLDLRQFTDKTPYTIMFGPDKCGSESKLHFIFRHINPKNQSIEEKHVKKLETKERSILEEVFKDKRPHLYRLVINPDNTYEVSVDYKVLNHGSLLEDFAPPVNPPAEIDDPNDRKPEDWDEREKIPDPEARKPDDWDESQPRQIIDESATIPDGWLEDEESMVPDPAAEKPDDWDNDLDGEWEAPLVDNPLCESAPGCGRWKKPMIDNPRYKGKWHAPLINNPAYKGKWKPRRIPNPDYYHDPDPFARMSKVGAVGVELWSMSSDIYFDNFLVTDEPEIASRFAQDTFDLKVQKLDANDAGMFRRILNYSNRNPWLYAVYLVVVGLPLVLIITFCCSSDTVAAKKDAIANGKKSLNHPKKTDAVQKDDEVEEEDGEEEEQEEEEEEEQQEEAVEEEETPANRRTSARKRRARKD